MAELPTTHGFEFRQEPVGSEVDLADRFGEPVWVPAQWPDGYDRPECLILIPPPDESDVDDRLSWYMLVSTRDGGELLEVSGARCPPGRNLEGGLLLLEGSDSRLGPDLQTRALISLSACRCGISMGQVLFRSTQPCLSLGLSQR